MPLLSQPWANPTWESSRVVARQGSLPAGVAYSMLQGIFFLGPFAMGAIAWETCSGIPGDVNTALQYVIAYRDRRPANAWSVAARLTAALARILALCFLAIYISYTHGATDLACQGWPRAVAAMSALALSFSVICFVLKAIGTARLNKVELGLLGTLGLAQLIIPLIAVHSWTGALTPAEESCYLRIKSWFGIFSLLPLITLAVVLGMLVAGQTNEKYRFSSYIGQRTSLASSRSSRPGSSGTAQSNASPQRLVSDHNRTHVERLYQKNQSSSQFRRAGSPEEANIQESFLRLTGEDGESIVERDSDREKKVNMFFIRFGTLWGLSFLTLLAGTIIAFMNPSPILTFMYQPVLTILPVLCASRLACLHFGRTTRHSHADGTASQRSLSSSQRDATLTEKGLAPEPFALRSSISPLQSASVRSEIRGGRVTPGHRARSLLHYMSARSLRDQLQGYRRQDHHEEDSERPPSSLKGQISYPFTPEMSTTPQHQTPTSFAMTRAHSEGPRLTFAPESDMLMTTGLPSLRSVDNLNWTPRSANLGLAPQPARRKLPSLTTSISDGSSGEAPDTLHSPRKAPFNLLTPPIEQRPSTVATASTRASGTSSVDRSSTALRNLPSPNDGSNKPSSSWPASSDSETRDNMSTRRSSDLEAKGEEKVNELRNIGEVEELGSEPQRQSHRLSFAEMSLDNPRDRSIELSSADGDHQRAALAALTGQQEDKAALRPPRAVESSARPLTTPKEPSINSLAVSIEDADEDELKQLIDSRGFAKPAPSHGLSKEEKFRRALSLRAGEKGKQPAVPDGPMDDQPMASGSGTVPGAPTEASFGAAEISHNPRLKRLDSMGKKPRTNPFWPYRQPKLTEQDRKESDQSGSSGPSQVTGVTSSSGSGSGSGSGSVNSRATNASYPDRRTHATRVGVGERGGAPSPIKQLGSSKKHPPVTGVASKDTKYSAKSKTSQQSSEGGRSAESNGTFGMKTGDNR